MLPRVALVDPQLTHSVPPDVTASTGMDALTQVLEPFVSVRANPLTDALCQEGMGRAARALRRVYAAAAGFTIDNAAWEQFTDLPARWVGCSTRHTAHCVPLCCRMSQRLIFARCASASRTIRRWHVTMKPPVFLLATPLPALMTPLTGCARCWWT